MKYHVLYNPLSGNGLGHERSKKLYELLSGKEVVYEDVTKIDNLSVYLSEMDLDDRIVLCGGDGTLNHFANDLQGESLSREIYYYPAGSGNDFANDVNQNTEKSFFLLNPYLENLPIVTINGVSRRFINGIGYGIDGYCCEEGDKVRSKSNKPVNYTPIAVKGLVYDFKPRNAVVTIDGETREYQRVWLAPTMFGRFFGGGMKMAPNQDRGNEQHEVSVIVVHDAGRLNLLPLFPKIFTGEHIKHTRYVEVKKGHNVHVMFDTPCALQIDGETLLNVKEYSVTTV